MNGGTSIGLIYYIFCLFLNATDVQLGFDRVTISIHPLPWAGSRIVPASSFTGFSVKERYGTKGRVTFAVSYVDPQNKEKTLLARLPNQDQANYICGSLTAAYLKN